jgi:hypothetical protein
MSTVRTWLDEGEIDWSTPLPATVIRIRRDPEPREQSRRPAAVGVLLVAAAIAVLALFVLGRDAAPGGPLPTPALRVPTGPPASAAAAVDPTLDAIAHCESRGDPTAVSADGVFRGKYQFDLATWRSVGGNGDPALASEREQDHRARVLADQRGTAPWPICGH